MSDTAIVITCALSITAIAGIAFMLIRSSQQPQRKFDADYEKQRQIHEKYIASQRRKEN